MPGVSPLPPTEAYALLHRAPRVWPPLKKYSERPSSRGMPFRSSSPLQPAASPPPAAPAQHSSQETSIIRSRSSFITSMLSVRQPSLRCTSSQQTQQEVQLTSPAFEDVAACTLSDPSAGRAKGALLRHPCLTTEQRHQRWRHCKHDMRLTPAGAVAVQAALSPNSTSAALETATGKGLSTNTMAVANGEAAAEVAVGRDGGEEKRVVAYTGPLKLSKGLSRCTKKHKGVQAKGSSPSTAEEMAASPSVGITIGRYNPRALLPLDGLSRTVGTESLCLQTGSRNDNNRNSSNGSNSRPQQVLLNLKAGKGVAAAELSTPTKREVALGGDGLCRPCLPLKDPFSLQVREALATAFAGNTTADSQEHQNSSPQRPHRVHRPHLLAQIKQRKEAAAAATVPTAGRPHFLSVSQWMTHPNAAEPRDVENSPPGMLKKILPHCTQQLPKVHLVSTRNQRNDKHPPWPRSIQAAAAVEAPTQAQRQQLPQQKQQQVHVQHTKLRALRRRSCILRERCPERDAVCDALHLADSIAAERDCQRPNPPSPPHHSKHASSFSNSPSGTFLCIKAATCSDLPEDAASRAAATLAAATGEDDLALTADSRLFAEATYCGMPLQGASLEWCGQAQDEVRIKSSIFAHSQGWEVMVLGSSEASTLEASMRETSQQSVLSVERRRRGRNPRQQLRQGHWKKTHEEQPHGGLKAKATVREAQVRQHAPVTRRLPRSPLTLSQDTMMQPNCGKSRWHSPISAGAETTAGRTPTAQTEKAASQLLLCGDLSEEVPEALWGFLPADEMKLYARGRSSSWHLSRLPYADLGWKQQYSNPPKRPGQGLATAKRVKKAEMPPERKHWEGAQCNEEKSCSVYAVAGETCHIEENRSPVNNFPLHYSEEPSAAGTAAGDYTKAGVLASAEARASSAASSAPNFVGGLRQYSTSHRVELRQGQRSDSLGLSPLIRGVEVSVGDCFSLAYSQSSSCASRSRCSSRASSIGSRCNSNGTLPYPYGRDYGSSFDESHDSRSPATASAADGDKQTGRESLHPQGGDHKSPRKIAEREGLCHSSAVEADTATRDTKEDSASRASLSWPLESFQNLQRSCGKLKNRIFSTSRGVQTAKASAAAATSRSSPPARLPLLARELLRLRTIRPRTQCNWIWRMPQQRIQRPSKLQRKVNLPAFHARQQVSHLRHRTLREQLERQMHLHRKQPHQLLFVQGYMHGKYECSNFRECPSSSLVGSSLPQLPHQPDDSATASTCQDPAKVPFVGSAKEPSLANAGTSTTPGSVAVQSAVHFTPSAANALSTGSKLPQSAESAEPSIASSIPFELPHYPPPSHTATGCAAHLACDTQLCLGSSRLTPQPSVASEVVASAVEEATGHWHSGNTALKPVVNVAPTAVRTSTPSLTELPIREVQWEQILGCSFHEQQQRQRTNISASAARAREAARRAAIASRKALSMASGATACALTATAPLARSFGDAMPQRRRPGPFPRGFSEQLPPVASVRALSNCKKSNCLPDSASIVPVDPFLQGRGPPAGPCKVSRTTIATAAASPAAASASFLQTHTTAETEQQRDPGASKQPGEQLDESGKEQPTCPNDHRLTGHLATETSKPFHGSRNNKGTSSDSCRTNTLGSSKEVKEGSTKGGQHPKPEGTESHGETESLVECTYTSMPPDSTLDALQQQLLEQEAVRQSISTLHRQQMRQQQQCRDQHLPQGGSSQVQRQQQPQRGESGLILLNIRRSKQPSPPRLWEHKRRKAQEQRNAKAAAYGLLLQQQHLSLGRLQMLQERATEQLAAAVGLPRVAFIDEET
ncbi:hypothetical protein cyc_08360 [Cyclospora cayetanensis]|uniref:Uncharacterized protein n=1 Tax=Cyclospora cayetanensis TaxID=88456 RepID=A0A1D3D2C9_9EIME|nr:hypothetical protein cyc_08360 [Cyclospora cayetanensis]